MMGSRELGTLRVGDRATIEQVGRPDTAIELVRRLLEMGFLEGAQVEVLHEAPFGRDPIAVRVRGATLALRRSEANQIKVSIL